MDKNTVALKFVNVVDRVEPAPHAPVPVGTMITITKGRTKDWTKARIVDFSRGMSKR